MGRIPCCEKESVKRGQWTPEEDNKLSSYIAQHGTRNWRLIPKNAGLQRCGKSCRLRWTNYLRPDLKHGEFSDPEEQTIVKLHSVVGNRWSLIAAQLPGRTDNDVKNHWNTKLKKKLSGMGIDPVTHKSFSHLMAEIAAALPPPQVAHLAEAALGCFKDEMLHLLSKKHVDFATGSRTHGPHPPAAGMGGYHNTTSHMENKEDTVQKIKLGLSRAIMQEHASDKSWALMGTIGESPICRDNMMYPTTGDGFGVDGGPSYGNHDGDGSAWSTCTGGGGAAEHNGTVLHDKRNDDDDDDGEEAEGGNEGRKPDAVMYGSDCVLWDLPEDLMNPIFYLN